MLNVELLRVPAGDTSLAVLRYNARRARGVTLVVGHGYSSSKQNLDFLCGFLSSHGFTIYSLDFPGHKLGASGGYLSGIDDCIASMSAVVARASQHHEGALYTMGHSLGAMTAIFTAALDPAVSGVISIATGFGRASAIVALQKAGFADFRSSYVDGVPLPELMTPVDQRFAELLPGLAGRPSLFIAASRDGMVNLASVRELYERAPEPKTLVEVESDHTFAGDNSRPHVLQWLNSLHPRA